ncbi:MAG TPA: hypothetical protein PLO61_10345 [Fimbriimonadaceae bacterium]|nr:hypothetical protein [Fimbriimonadaceae bacterium]HRJ33999.1 hypothetical protein [Fimbriimonadaceae bacterium]
MIFSPVTLRSLTLKNRLVVAPMTTYSSHPDGQIRDSELEYLHRRAKGGFGMVMTAACYVHKSGHAFRGQWACSGEEFMPSLRAASGAIQSGGSAAVLQIHHGGRACSAALSGEQPWSASAIPSERPNAETPRAMTETDIQTAIDAYASAALRAKRARFDGVEIHGANTYLLQQFVSPHSNRRNDAWGQDRLKFPLAVVDAVLAAVGPDFPVGYRFSPEEMETPGIRWPDTAALLESLAQRPLAWVHISLGKFDQSSLVGDYDDPTLARVHRALGGRVPLIGVGQIQTLDDAERCLQLGCELVAIGRAAITEPEWPMVALAGGQPRLKMPRQDAESKLTLPAGLVERIAGAPGWFETEEDEVAASS